MGHKFICNSIQSIQVYENRNVKQFIGSDEFDSLSTEDFFEWFEERYSCNIIRIFLKPDENISRNVSRNLFEMTQPYFFAAENPKISFLGLNIFIQVRIQ